MQKKDTVPIWVYVIIALVCILIFWILIYGLFSVRTPSNHVTTYEYPIYYHYVNTQYVDNPVSYSSEPVYYQEISTEA